MNDTVPCHLAEHTGVLRTDFATGQTRESASVHRHTRTSLLPTMVTSLGQRHDLDRRRCEWHITSSTLPLTKDHARQGCAARLGLSSESTNVWTFAARRYGATDSAQSIESAAQLRTVMTLLTADMPGPPTALTDLGLWSAATTIYESLDKRQELEDHVMYGLISVRCADQWLGLHLTHPACRPSRSWRLTATSRTTAQLPCA